jgi:uncharacterized HhH-GPD family protein
MTNNTDRFRPARHLLQDESAPLTPQTERLFTPDRDADRLVRSDPFAFLVGVLFDHGIPPERAWRAPYELATRLGHLDPRRVATEPEAVLAAVAQAPALHRYVATLAGWVVSAGQRVVQHHGGDASEMWSDQPTRAVLVTRLTGFDGIGRTKAEKAVHALEHDLGVALSDDEEPLGQTG